VPETRCLSTTDLSIQGSLGGIAIQRVYRTLSNNNCPFGPGDELGYDWDRSATSPNTAQAINLIQLWAAGHSAPERGQLWASDQSVPETRPVTGVRPAGA